MLLSPSQPASTLAAAAGDHRAARLAAHPDPKSVGLLPTPTVWLERPFHPFLPLMLARDPDPINAVFVDSKMNRAIAKPDMLPPLLAGVNQLLLRSLRNALEFFLSDSIACANVCRSSGKTISRFASVRSQRMYFFSTPVEKTVQNALSRVICGALGDRGSNSLYSQR